jgi:hypothetical protein
VKNLENNSNNSINNIMNEKTIINNISKGINEDVERLSSDDKNIKVIPNE